MRGFRKAAVVACAAGLAAGMAACGGDDDGAATTKAAWQREHGTLVAAYEKDLDGAGDTINRGEKQATISACTQLSDDAKEMRSEVFPVPNPTVDAALRASVDLAVKGADNCIAGGRRADGADQVEAAMKELTDARQKFREAKAAIEVWKDPS